MNISLLRIDSRLIHGQVATSWAKAVKCEAIFAVNDDGRMMRFVVIYYSKSRLNI